MPELLLALDVLEVADELLEDVVELFDDVEEFEDDDADDDSALAAGVTGENELLPTPKPILPEKVPTTVIRSVELLAVRTISPPVLSDAVTAALPVLLLLIALIRSPTVSEPVDIYFVVFVPSLNVNVAPLRTPSVKSDVVRETGTVPVPVAGVGFVAVLEALLEELDVDEEASVVVESEDDEPVSDVSALWIAAVSALLVRVSAV